MYTMISRLDRNILCLVSARSISSFRNDYKCDVTLFLDRHDVTSLAKKKGVIVGDYFSLPFENDHFDVIIASDFFIGKKYFRWAIQEATRVLKPKGAIQFLVNNSFSLKRLTSFNFWASKIGIQNIQPKPYFRKKTLRKLLNSIHLELNNSNQTSTPWNSILSKISAGDFLVISAVKKEETKAINYYSAQEGLVDLVRSEPLYQNFCERLEKWIMHNGIKEEGVSKIDSWSDKKLMILSPHPDDEIIGCGGVMLSAIEENSDVIWIQIMDGRESRIINSDPSIDKSIRNEEAKCVAAAMNGVDLQIWDVPLLDEAICIDLGHKLLREIIENKPDVIFLPFMNDRHPDHRMTNQILYNALELQSEELVCDVYSYEVWGKVPVNVMFSIKKFMSEKNNLLRKYKIAMMAMDYADHCLKMNSYYGKLYSDNKDKMEVFYRADNKEWKALYTAHLKNLEG